MAKMEDESHPLQDGSFSLISDFLGVNSQSKKLLFMGKLIQNKNRNGIYDKNYFHVVGMPIAEFMYLFHNFQRTYISGFLKVSRHV